MCVASPEAEDVKRARFETLNSDNCVILRSVFIAIPDCLFVCSETDIVRYYTYIHTH